MNVSEAARGSLLPPSDWRLVEESRVIACPNI